MSKVLVVDDERGYRDFLELHLRREGYEVKTATTGREAIDIGARYRPKVLVADWLLNNHIHGLFVADVLQVVDPDLHTILITGFSSQDLKAEADKMHVYAFIEKPFDLDDILSVVHDAAKATPPPPPHWRSLAIVEVDATGIIRYANTHARELFAQTFAGQHATSIADVLGHHACTRIDEAAERWIEVAPQAPEPPRWRLRARHYPETEHRLLVVLPEGRDHSINDPAIYRLLDLPLPTRLRWPFQGPALIIDDYTIYRHLTMHQLELVDCVCHTATTHDEGQRLFASDPTISVVILADNEYPLPNRAMARLVTTLRAIRPEVPIVGTSALDRRDEFAAVGVSRFLLKPWRAEDLIRVLT